MKTSEMYNKRSIKVKTKSYADKTCYLFSKHREKLGIEQVQLDLNSCLENDDDKIKDYFNHVHDHCGTSMIDGDIKLVPLKETKEFFRKLKVALGSGSSTQVPKKKFIIGKYKKANYRIVLGHNYEKIDKVNERVPVRFKNKFTYLL